MGYYSSYTLTIQEPEQITPEEIISQFRQEYPEAAYALSEDGDTEQTAKWYDCAENLTEFSKQYPHHVFILHSLGEEGEQIKYYAKNGKVQEAKMVPQFEPFDESKLK